MKAMLIQSDTAPMPKYIQSTYQSDYISPIVRRREKALQAIAAMPPDYLDENAGKRILPTTFTEVYQNCVSASIGDRLELQFMDDTPEWKRQNRAAAAAYWIRPLEERRLFVETSRVKGSGNGGGGGGQANGGKTGSSENADGTQEIGGFLPGDQYVGGEGDVCGVIDSYITEIPDSNFPNGCEGMANANPC